MGPSRVVSGFVPAADPTNVVLVAIQNMQTEMNKNQHTTMDLLNDIQWGFNCILSAKNKEDGAPKVSSAHVVEPITVPQKKHTFQQEEAKFKIVNPRQIQTPYSHQDSIFLQKMQHARSRQPTLQPQQRRATPQPLVSTVQEKLRHQNFVSEESQSIEPRRQPSHEDSAGVMVNKEQMYADSVHDSIVLQMQGTQQREPTPQQQQIQPMPQRQPLVHPLQHQHPALDKVQPKPSRAPAGELANKEQVHAGSFDDSMVQQMQPPPPILQKQPIPEPQQCLAQPLQRRHVNAPKEVHLVALPPDPPFQDYCSATPQPRQQQLPTKTTSSPCKQSRLIALPPDQPFLNSGQQQFNLQQQQQRCNLQQSRKSVSLIGLQPDQPLASSSQLQLQQQQETQQQAPRQDASVNNLVVGLQPDQPFDQSELQDSTLSGHHPSAIHYLPADQVL